jgi:hypothetical protein
MKQRKSVVTDQPSTSGNPVDPNTPPPDNPTPEQALAAQMIASLEAFQALIPNFQPRDPATSRKVATAARYAADLTPLVISAVESYAPPEGGVNFDMEGAKATLAFSNAMVAVRQRLDAIRDGFNYTVDRRSASGGLQSLQFYTWAKSHAKGITGIGLRPYMVTLTKAVRRIQGRSKSSAASTPTPTPAPTPPPAGAHTFLAPNLGKVADENIAEQFDRALEEAAKD